MKNLVYLVLVLISPECNASELRGSSSHQHAHLEEGRWTGHLTWGEFSYRQVLCLSFVGKIGSHLCVHNFLATLFIYYLFIWMICSVRYALILNLLGLIGLLILYASLESFRAD